MSSRSENLYSEIVETDGVLFVAAAGNQGSSKLFYPASHPSVISVAAVFEWNMYWGGSNWGTQIEVCRASSVNITSNQKRLCSARELFYVKLALSQFSGAFFPLGCGSRLQCAVINREH